MNTVIYKPTQTKEEIIVNSDQTFIILGKNIPTEQEVVFRLMKRGVTVRIIGLEARTQEQKILQVRIEHAAEDTKSRFDFRALLAGNAKSTVYGMIKIHSNARGADAYFSHRTLLLDKNGEPQVQTIPGLEIEADEVKAGHAATVATLDQDDLDYLASRGMDQRKAAELLITGFLEASTGALSLDADTKKRIERYMRETSNSLFSYV